MKVGIHQLSLEVTHLDKKVDEDQIFHEVKETHYLLSKVRFLLREPADLPRMQEASKLLVAVVIRWEAVEEHFNASPIRP